MHLAFLLVLFLYSVFCSIYFHHFVFKSLIHSSLFQLFCYASSSNVSSTSLFVCSLVVLSLWKIYFAASSPLFSDSGSSSYDYSEFFSGNCLSPFHLVVFWGFVLFLHLGHTRLFSSWLAFCKCGISSEAAGL